MTVSYHKIYNFNFEHTPSAYLFIHFIVFTFCLSSIYQSCSHSLILLLFSLFQRDILNVLSHLRRRPLNTTNNNKVFCSSCRILSYISHFAHSEMLNVIFGVEGPALTSFTIHNIHRSPFGGYYTPYIAHIIQFQSLCSSSFAFLNCFNDLSIQRRDFYMLNISNSVHCLWIDNRQFEWSSFFEHQTPNTEPSTYNIQIPDSNANIYLYVFMNSNDMNTQLFNLIDIFSRS